MRKHHTKLSHSQRAYARSNPTRTVLSYMHYISRYILQFSKSLLSWHMGVFWEFSLFTEVWCLWCQPEKIKEWPHFTYATFSIHPPEKVFTLIMQSVTSSEKKSSLWNTKTKKWAGKNPNNLTQKRKPKHKLAEIEWIPLLNPSHYTMPLYQAAGCKFIFVYTSVWTLRSLILADHAWMSSFSFPKRT